MTAFAFDLTSTDGAARAGVLRTAHGDVRTPAFMPVGTGATVKGLAPADIVATGAEMVLCNTYHLMLRPGTERVARLGGLHKFMNWPGPILTDSGGYQVLSLAELRRVDESGVTFRSHLDGSAHELTPERVVQAQVDLDSTVAMVLDECLKFPVSKDDAADSMGLTLRWAARCREAWPERAGYGLFGIVQGSVFPDLRAECADGLRAIGFEGYAIGGIAVGESPEDMLAVVGATAPLLPAGLPRYLMGVGKPEQLVAAVQCGVDMFDCVLPTRSGRTGQAFTRDGPLNLRNAQFAEDQRPLDPDCGCSACRDHDRAYLHHLVRSREILGAMLLTRHNVTFYQDVLAGLRLSIGAGESAAWAAAFTARYGAATAET
jgi:queuine tRNA-ribosyltransferase